MKVITNSKKSDLRPTWEKSRGVDLDFGDWIIFEYNGDTYKGICQGWLVSNGVPLVKTDITDGWVRVDLPLDKVWRVRDARDDRIAELEELLDSILD